MGHEERANPFSQSRKRAEGIGPYDLLDCYGRVLRAGDFVIVKDLTSVTWRVVEVKPDLRPNPEAPNVPIVQLTLAAVMQPLCGGGMPIANFVKVRDASEGPQEAPPAPVEEAQG